MATCRSHAHKPRRRGRRLGAIRAISVVHPVQVVQPCRLLAGTRAGKPSCPDSGGAHKRCKTTPDLHRAAGEASHSSGAGSSSRPRWPYPSRSAGTAIGGTRTCCRETTGRAVGSGRAPLGRSGGLRPSTAAGLPAALAADLLALVVGHVEYERALTRIADLIVTCAPLPSAISLPERSETRTVLPAID